AERAYHVLLEPRRHLQRRHDRAELEAPCFVLERFGCGTRDGSADACRARERDALAEQGAAIDESIAGNEIMRGRSPPAIGFAHEILPAEGVFGRPARRDGATMLRLWIVVVQIVLAHWRRARRAEDEEKNKRAAAPRIAPRSRRRRFEPTDSDADATLTKPRAACRSGGQACAARARASDFAAAA